MLTQRTSLIAIRNTLIFSSGVTLFCLVIGTSLALLLSRTRVWASPFFRQILSLPYAIPPYIGAIAWVILANPNSGLLNTLIGDKIFNIYSFSGLIWVEGSFLYTYVFLSCLAALDNMDSSMEEAARLSGAHPIAVFKDITLPLILPTLSRSAILVFLTSCASFGVPAMIGGPGGIYLLTTQIYTYLKMATVGGLNSAIILSTPLFVFTLLITFFSFNYLSKLRTQTVSGKIARRTLVSLGSWHNMTLILLGFFSLVTFILPILGIAYSALSTIQGNLSWDNLTFANFSRVLFETDETPRAFFNSLVLAIGVSSLACAFAVLLVYLLRQSKSWSRNVYELFIALPYSTPGTVLALSLILAFSQSFFGMPFSLYNTLFLLGLAYFLKFFSISMSSIQSAFDKIHPCLEEASQISGASWIQTLKNIFIPLLWPTLISTWFLIFVPILSELTISVLLTGPGIETIGTLIFQMQEYSDHEGGGSAVLSLCALVLVLMFNSLLTYASKKRAYS